MNIKPIRNDDDLTQAFIALERVFQAENGTPEADERDILLTLIEAYEAQHYPIQLTEHHETLARNIDLQQYYYANDEHRFIVNRQKDHTLISYHLVPKYLKQVGRQFDIMTQKSALFLERSLISL